jgi:phospholipid/cholesterol/gamma-HCH transport system substrate-binding protein
MENKSHAMAAGAFVLAMLLMLGSFAAWLTLDRVQLREYEISSAKPVNGLQLQAAVRYKGIAVGRVSALGLDPEVPHNILIRIAVNETVALGTSSYAKLAFQGLTGLAYIELDDTGEDGQPLAAQDGKVARIPMRAGLVEQLTERGSRLAGQLEQAGDRINTLLAPDNQKTLMAAIVSLDLAAQSLQRVSQRADGLLATATTSLQTDLPALRQQASEALGTVQDAARQIGDSAQAAQTAAAQLGQLSTRVAAPGGVLDQVSQGLTSTLPALGRTAREVAGGSRAIGRAARDINDNPPSLLFGRAPAAPGPGEPGFAPSR